VVSKIKAKVRSIMQYRRKLKENIDIESAMGTFRQAVIDDDWRRPREENSRESA
jgi:hypothetical protein